MCHQPGTLDGRPEQRVASLITVLSDILYYLGSIISFNASDMDFSGLS
jgi:hypothetical protein